jgi:hypothetical protein
MEKALSVFGDPARGLGVFRFGFQKFYIRLSDRVHGQPRTVLWQVLFVFKTETQLVFQNLSGLCHAFNGNRGMLDALDLHGKTSRLIALGRRYENFFDRKIWIVSKLQEPCWFK